MKIKCFLIVLLGCIYLYGCRSNAVNLLQKMKTLVRLPRWIHWRTISNFMVHRKQQEKILLQVVSKIPSPFSGSLLTSSNVTGVFVEVWVLRLGQSVYFILMCLKPMDSCTVSVVVIGFGRAESGVIDFEFPISFNITITP